VRFQISNLKSQISILSRRGVMLGLLCLSLLPGCVHRRLTVSSNPPGARVLLDGEEVGETPTSVDFTLDGQAGTDTIMGGNGDGTDDGDSIVGSASEVDEFFGVDDSWTADVS
jgi:hypothetical protein